jgi:hypothetical protein
MSNENQKCEKCDYELVECDRERDTYECSVCGHSYTEACSFDEDMS